MSVGQFLRNLCLALLLQGLGGCASRDLPSFAGSKIVPPSAAPSLTNSTHAVVRSDAAAPAVVAPKKVVPLSQMGLVASVGLALAQHPDLGRADAAISQSRAEVTVAKAAWYPKLAYTSNLSALQPGSTSSTIGAGTHSVGLEGTQLLYDFGRSQSTLEAAEATSRQRSAELDDTRERVALATSEAHLEAARGAILASAADRYQVSLRRLFEMIKLRAASGAADQADVYFADVRLKGAQGEKVRTETRREAAQSKLYRLIGVRPASVADPGPTLATIAQRMAKHGSDGATGVAAAESAAAAAHARARAAEASLYPSINLRGTQTYAIADPGHGSQSVLGLSIQGDFFNGGATQGRITAAKQEARAAENSAALARLTTNVEVDTANADIRGAQARYAIFVHQADLARKSRDIYLAEYQIGKRTLTEVLNTEQEIYRAETEQINANADAWLAVVKAAAARGELVSQLQVLAAD